MSKIGYQYWLKCRPERLTFSSIRQGSISLTPAVQQGGSRLVVQASVVRYRSAEARLYFSKCARVNEMPSWKTIAYIQVYTTVYCPRPTRAGAIPQGQGQVPNAPVVQTPLGYRQSSDRA